MSSTQQLQVKNLSYNYHSNSVLENISFSIQKGDYIGLIGPNGGGKTTLVKLLLNLLPSPKGAINSYGCTIGYVPQRAALSATNFPATVLEIVNSGLVSKIASRKEKTVLVENSIKLTQIEHLKSKLISNLSGGELQKVLIARALVSKPEILILDEPIVGIDTPSQEAFYSLLKHLNTDLQITILFVSHDLDVITNQANKLFCLNKKLVSHSDPKDFLHHADIEQIFGKGKNLIHHHH